VAGRNLDRVTVISRLLDSCGLAIAAPENEEITKPNLRHNLTVPMKVRMNSFVPVARGLGGETAALYVRFPRRVCNIAFGS